MRHGLLFLAAALLAGCIGYTIGPVKPTRMHGISSIAVPSFESDVLVPRVEVLAADSVIKQIQLDGTYKVGRVGDADAILKGVVKSITRRPTRSVRQNVLATREFVLNVKFSYKVSNQLTGAVVMEGTVSGETSFFVSDDVNQDERQALPLAFGDAATRLVSTISEGF
jgi:hypothetical protein